MQADSVVQSAIKRSVARVAGRNSIQPLDLGNIIDWIQSAFYIPERVGDDNPAMQLADYQAAVLREACRTDENGDFVYDVVLWSDIKKSAKSTIAAAVVLYRALTTPRGRFRVVANDLKQANSRVFEFIKTAIELNPALRDRAQVKLYTIALDNGSRIEAVPIDPKGEAGGNDDLIEFTELHAAENNAAKKMWAEMTLSPLKAGRSQRWVDTYAGFSGESPLLEPLFEQGVKQGTQLSLPAAPLDLEVFASGSMLTLWNTIPRLPWQTEKYYSSEAVILTPSQFNRMHRNQWVSSEQSFIPIEWWDACKVAELTPIDRYREIVVALDAAVSNDCFAMVAMSRDGDKTVVRYARAWKPDGSVIIYSNPSDPTDRAYPEGELRWLINEYNVVCVTYDPYQLHSFCTGLAGEGLAAFEPFSQGDARLRADKGLYDHIRERRIVHDGNPDMREHLQNANSTAEERDTLRIVKRAAHLKIDLAVAMSMCNDRARHWLAE